MHVSFVSRRCLSLVVCVAVKLLKTSIYKTFSKLFEDGHIKYAHMRSRSMQYICVGNSNVLPGLEANLSNFVNIYKDLGNMSTGAVLKHLICVYRASKRPEVPLKPSKLVVVCLEPLYAK